jgi:hypothetical protein
MRVGVPKEIKVHEYRVGLTPASVAELIAAGHEVIVETQATRSSSKPRPASASTFPTRTMSLPGRASRRAPPRFSPPRT